MAGALLIQQLPGLPAPLLWLPLALGAVGLFRLGRPGLAGVSLGLCWAGGYAALGLADALTAQGRVQVLVEGRIATIPSPMDRGERFDLVVERILEAPLERLPRKLRVSWYRAGQAVKAGESWRLRLSLRPPRGMLNPGGFDYERWLFAQGIGAVGYVRESLENRRLALTAPGSWLPRWRQDIHDRLQAVWQHSPVAGLLMALTMGVEDGIGRPEWDVLRRTGTAHLIAISGSHIGLVAGLVFFLVRSLVSRLGPRQRLSPPRIAALAGLVGAWAYAALADFGIPTQRALIMVAMAMGAVVLQRPTHVAHLLALALIAVVLRDPLAVLAPGFWLSFAAVALIAYGVRGRLAPARGGRLLWRINALTAVGLAPVLLLFFGQMSLVSPFANLLAVPVLGTLLIPLCLAGALLLPVSPALGQPLLALAEWVMRESWRVLTWIASLPVAQWTHPVPPLGHMALALAGVILLLAPRGVPARWLGLVMLLPALLYAPERLPPGGFRLTLLDVGQGLAAVVETRHRTLAFDAGAKLSRHFDMGNAVVEPYLRHRGLGRIDVLVISHGDNDHSGGARSLLQVFPVRHLLTSVPDLFRDDAAMSCQAGQGWRWDGVDFQMLGPVAASTRDNDNSCVLRVRGEGGSVLLTGDIEADAENRLVTRYGSALRSDVLVVPHHGSKTSSTPALLAAVRPRWGLVPAGYLNRFGFPHREVLERYRAFGIALMNVAEAGTLTVEPGAPGNRISPPQAFREGYRRYWLTR